MALGKDSIGELLLLIIDLYASEQVAQIQNLRFGQNYNASKGKSGEMLEGMREALLSRCSDLDIDWFVENLKRLRLLRTFDNLDSANDITRDFQQLGIEMPEFVKNCCREVEHRTNYINSLIDDHKYCWGEKEVEQFSQYLVNEVNAYAFGRESKIARLKELFNETVKEIKAEEKRVEIEYGYFIEAFYEGDSFVASKDDLNDFFFGCEARERTINEFYLLYKHLNKYIRNKNRLVELRRHINGGNQPIVTSKKMLKPVKQTGITQALRALFIYYLQEAGDEIRFENHPLGKEAAIEEFAAKEEVSAKAFQLAYNKISNYNSVRVAANQVENLKSVIPLLDNYPKAKEIAEKELREAEMKR